MEIPLIAGNKKNGVKIIDSGRNVESSASAVEGPSDGSASAQQQHVSDRTQNFKVYKRRWFGLFQLTLLNIIVSWDVSTPEPTYSMLLALHCILTNWQWLTFSAISTTASQYFGVSESAINWLSTGFLFAFVVICPYATSIFCLSLNA